eukprot:m.153889 g.153889  ORF g.153889 m.153889 type:complete len:367 (-) comp10180_c0_seq2:2140-3240(-)
MSSFPTVAFLHALIQSPSRASPLLLSELISIAMQTRCGECAGPATKQRPRQPLRQRPQYRPLCALAMITASAQPQVLLHRRKSVHGCAPLRPLPLWAACTALHCPPRLVRGALLAKASASALHRVPAQWARDTITASAQASLIHHLCLAARAWNVIRFLLPAKARASLRYQRCPKAGTKLPWATRQPVWRSTPKSSTAHILARSQFQATGASTLCSAQRRRTWCISQRCRICMPLQQVLMAKRSSCSYRLILCVPSPPMTARENTTKLSLPSFKTSPFPASRIPIPDVTSLDSSLWMSAWAVEEGGGGSMLRVTCDVYLWHPGHKNLSYFSYLCSDGDRYPHGYSKCPTEAQGKPRGYQRRKPVCC